MWYQLCNSNCRGNPYKRDRLAKTNADGVQNSEEDVFFASTFLSTPQWVDFDEIKGRKVVAQEAAQGLVDCFSEFGALNF